MAVLLSEKAVLLAGIESTYGTPASVGVNDGVLIGAPNFTVDAKMLERNFTQSTLSQVAHVIGRKLAMMEFETELRGSGRQQSGNLVDAPILSRLLRACGFGASAGTTSSVAGPYDIDTHANPVSWAATGVTTATNTDVINYYLEVTTGGASGTAQVTITSDTVGEGSAAAAITTATPRVVGTKGLSLTPTFTGTLALGQRWIVTLLPKGITVRPISDLQESVTLVMYRDGVKHVMPGAYGTFSIDATAGEYAKIKWKFTGRYVAPVDEATPVPNYERTLPPVVELARLRLNTFNAIVEKFTFDADVDIQVRPDVSSADGYVGTRIVGRAPKGGINPEADLVAQYNFWAELAAARRIPFQMRVGSAVGNTVWVVAPGVQYTGLTYTDRNNILAYDAGLRFPMYNGNDEVLFHFC